LYLKDDLLVLVQESLKFIKKLEKLDIFDEKFTIFNSSMIPLLRSYFIDPDYARNHFMNFLFSENFRKVESLFLKAKDYKLKKNYVLLKSVLFDLFIYIEDCRNYMGRFEFFKRVEE